MRALAQVSTDKKATGENKKNENDPPAAAQVHTATHTKEQSATLTPLEKVMEGWDSLSRLVNCHAVSCPGPVLCWSCAGLVMVS